MTDQTKDGGPAFPAQPEMVEVCEDGKLKPWGYSGMSLRDWFAGQALIGLTEVYARDTRTKDIAQMAFLMADAMIKARGQE